MAENKKLVPKRRFKEFQNAGEWEKRKLCEFSSYNTSSLTVGNAKVNGKYQLYDANEMIGYTNEAAQSNDYITIIKDGSGVGRVRLLPKSTSFIGTMGAILSNNSDINFLYCCLENTDFSKHINGATIPHVYYRDYGNDEYFVPSILEQKKIGTFFINLDNLITLHQSKLDKIKSMKKAYLSEMFPAIGESRPKRRFKEFSGDWELRKLGDLLLNIGTGKSKYIIHETQSFDIPYPILGSRSIIGYDNNYDYTGDFILTARVGENAGKLYRYSGNAKITDNTVFMQSDSLVFNFYLLLHSDLTKLSFGSGQPLIKASELKGLEVVTPKDNEEKSQIANFFSSLDNLISLNQQKLDKLKNLKKAYLNEMFI